MKDYARILKEELVPAMGCTEPIAIALCAAKARELLGREPDTMALFCSGNIIKNAQSVTVPGTGGMCGMAAAAAAGCFGGDPALMLEVLRPIDEQALAQARDFVAAGRVRVHHARGVDSLYIRARLTSGEDWAEAVIEGGHARFVSLMKNGRSLPVAAAPEAPAEEAQETGIDVAEILHFVESLDFGSHQDLADLIDRQIDYNLRIAEEGLENSYGAMVGRTLMDAAPDSLRERIRAYAAAGSDARMAGCTLPVVINSGSGNQGITASLPLIVYATEKNMSQEALRRGLVWSNLLAIQMKALVGKLSAFCGVVSAAAAAGAGLAFLQGLDLAQMEQVISTSLLTAGGIFCDGAKASCASKIAVALECSLLALDMAKNGRSLKTGQGLNTGDINQTIREVARIAREGMRETDHMILESMLKTGAQGAG